eukprot:COSAG05_NODE_1297_length_5246_cov_2.847873_9_plen_55_part_00
MKSQAGLRGTPSANSETDAKSAFAIGLGMFSTKDERNDKHQLLLNNAFAWVRDR